jgi:hypothetical protein
MFIKSYNISQNNRVPIEASCVGQVCGEIDAETIPSIINPHTLFSCMMVYIVDHTIVQPRVNCTTQNLQEAMSTHCSG